MAEALDFLRRDALRKRVNGISGGNRIVWRDADLAEIHDRVMSARPEEIVRAAQPIEVKSDANSDRVALTKIGIELRSDIGPEDNPVFIITSPRVDLVGDSVNAANVETTDFVKNAAVLDGHDSSKPPIAVSTRPWLSGDKLLAIARFPAPGISADSDRIAAAVRARLMRAASIGFLPIKWSFSKDPARPLGINFEAIKIIEWSICSLPANPDCLLVGAVSSGTPTPSDGKMADLRREARALAAKARSISQSIADPQPTTREQRLAEAHNFRRAAMAARK